MSHLGLRRKRKKSRPSVRSFVYGSLFMSSFLLQSNFTPSTTSAAAAAAAATKAADAPVLILF